ncbi:exodeoxyribonuclease VII large subunit [Melghiribacillus thermohalophilus]|uniref:Exodeoxyribonuclease 7 large subunit n=1 Tax=Melghiribacillus thermohalophilus TaxID=1324956 RepID=A0A4R3N2V0_9BACI|nr:exodeoxyribonuclease VII large subunit [Melghiribacillus thermohalophilus]TCT22617.1 exodeoxyribonuclease VII large subunit [Melghiribacillus thermohalophilus]
MMEDRYLTVTALTKYIKRKIEMDSHLKQVWLKGEISNFKRHSRGHMYFTLKDDLSRIQAVMFAGSNRHLKFSPKDGMNVLVRGEVGVYEPHGQYQLYVHDMQPGGVGALYLAFEELKKKLEKEGLFAADRKKPIPRFPEHIGIITSPTGAAIRDIWTTLNRRYPIVKKTLIPVLVQGEHAAKSIVDAIERANEHNLFDVLIVGRGGGSIEELWCFNEEMVARAIARSRIPVISAVGHETDYTISDFVADLRAPTPTGAAELAVPDRQEILKRIQYLKNRLDRSLHVSIQSKKDYLSSLKQSYAFRYPEVLMRQKEQELDRHYDKLMKEWNNYFSRKVELHNSLGKRLQTMHPDRKIAETENILHALISRYNRAMRNQLTYKKKSFQNQIDKLSLLNPLDIMKRGYAIPFNKEGHIVRTVKQIQPGDKIDVKLADGTLDCQVWGLEEEDNHE